MTLWSSHQAVEGVNPLSQKTISSASNFSDELATTRHQESTQSRGTINIMDDKLVAVFDHCKISDRNAIKRLSSIFRSREKIREEKVKQIKELFKTEDLNASVLHWDRKTSSGNNKERLPVVLSCRQIEKILAIPVLDDGTGQSQADAMFDAVIDWASGPDVPLFKRFRDSWTEIDTSQFSTGIEDSYVQNKIQDHIEDINQFIQQQLDSEQPREDYKELLELVKDAKISEVALKKFSKHLWYLNPETADMAFFDERIPLNIKNQMVIMLKIIEKF
ncbi:unnamed protein product [Brassicogethes aeneus]|uniref:Uncharacterized protein n=1 Tax=Brassicogethes aeneus TaxID=1431903 RepID=A0A9P0FH34_BRAAE|nr:unnamed protein product [Brassicogethes aeneus]